MNSENMYSIDRLVEFGLGIGIAQQMIKSMNHAVQNSAIPGVQTAPYGASAAHNYFCAIDGKQAGPFSVEELTRMISSGNVVRTTLLWRPGLTRWDLAENIPDVLKLVALMPPPLPTTEEK